MRKTIAILILLLSTMGFTAIAQSPPGWSLEKCYQYALENNLNLKNAQYGVQRADMSYAQSKAERIPGLSASTTGGIQFGRTIDPTTNTFNTERIGFNSYSINTSVPVFSGGAINNSIKRGKLELQISELDAESTANDLGLSVANAYLAVLLAKEQVNNAEKNIALSQIQLDQTDQMIEVGSLPANNRLDILSKLALDEQTLIQAKNQLDNSLLSLKQLLYLGPEEDFDIIYPEVNVPEDAMPEAFLAEEIFVQALSRQPEIKASQKRVESAAISAKITKSSVYPTLAAFGSLSSNYSSVALDFANPDLSNSQIVQNTPYPVLINGADATITEFDITGIEFPKKRYFDQIADNFGQNVGLQLSVPIFNNNRNKLNNQLAEINILQTQLMHDQNKQTLLSNIQTAVANAKAGKLAFAAAQRSEDAAKAAYDNAQKKYDLGAINTFEYTTARNTLDQANINLIQAKYQYIFYLKVVDFYLGKKITF